jgi:hypothetical protein
MRVRVGKLLAALIVATLAGGAAAAAEAEDGAPAVVGYSTNAAGFRDDREYEVPKPPGVRRLVFVGDGFTFGVGLPLEDTFVEQLERRLAAWRGAPYRWEVFNVSAPARNLIAKVALLELEGLRYRPDVVVLMYHLNDAQGNQDTRLGNGPATFTRLLDFVHGDVSRVEAAAVQGFLRDEGYLASLRPILRDVEKRDQGYLLAHYLPLYWEPLVEALDRVERLAEARGFDVIVGFIPEIDSPWADYPFDDLHLRVRGAMEAHRFSFVDLTPVLSEYPNHELMLGGTDGHTNALANAIIAEVLEARLADLSD